MPRRLAAVLALALALPAAAADDYSVPMRAYLDGSIRPWAQDPVLVQAALLQNGDSAGLDQAGIDALDTRWRGEVGTAATPTIDPVLNNAAAEFLRARIAEAGGTITEAFLMDSRGLLVAASGVTSDYWQGDEEKFTETFAKGADAVHLSEVEFDESSQTFQGQVSIPLVDPATGQVIGALTVGLDAEALS